MAEDPPVKGKRISRTTTPGVEKARRIERDMNSEEVIFFDDESDRLTELQFRELLVSCVMSGAPDITFQSDQPPKGEFYGILNRTMRRPLTTTEVDMILMETYGSSNAKTEINSQAILDYSYELNLPDGSRQRYRVNATGIEGFDGRSVEISFRGLPKDTPTLEGVSLPQELAETLSPREGLVVFAGATGSGKSTSMAALTRFHLENPKRRVKIVDIQKPIEYTFRDVMGIGSRSASIIGQSEVGKHIKSFADGVHSALRRKPHIIIVGESRDFETISASIEASMTGHLVYTTTHAASVSDTIRRLLLTFPGFEREGQAYNLASTLRYIVVQHLIPRLDRPGRVPVREMLRITERVRLKMLTTVPERWPEMLNEEVMDGAKDVGPDDFRQSFADECRALYKGGVIDYDDALHVGGPRAVL